jgi:hypothetical protein
VAIRNCRAFTIRPPFTKYSCFNSGLYCWGWIPGILSSILNESSIINEMIHTLIQLDRTDCNIIALNAKIHVFQNLTSCRNMKVLPCTDSGDICFISKSKAQKKIGLCKTQYIVSGRFWVEFIAGFRGVIKIEGIGRSMLYDNHAGLNRLSIFRYRLSILKFKTLILL